MGVRQALIATPPTCTVQAPHWPIPQPYLVPRRSSRSRKTHSSGISAGASTVLVCPFTESLKAILSPPDTRYSTPVVGQTIGFRGLSFAGKAIAKRRRDDRRQKGIVCPPLLRDPPPPRPRGGGRFHVHPRARQPRQRSQEKHPADDQR